MTAAWPAIDAFLTIDTMQYKLTIPDITYRYVHTVIMTKALSTAIAIAIATRERQ